MSRSDFKTVLKEYGFEKYDQRVIHVLLERQYQVSKALLTKLDEKSLNEEIVSKICDDVLKRRFIYSIEERQKLSKSNNKALPVLQGTPKENLQYLIFPEQSAPTPTVAIPQPTPITEDLGPNENTVFAQRKAAVSITFTGLEQDPTGEKRLGSEADQPRKKARN